MPHVICTHSEQCPVRDCAHRAPHDVMHYSLGGHTCAKTAFCDIAHDAADEHFDVQCVLAEQEH